MIRPAILIASDRQELAVALEIPVSRLRPDFEWIVAADAPSALAELDRRPPDAGRDTCLLIDLSCPDAGLDLLRRARAHPVGARAPALMTLEDAARWPAARQAGADDLAARSARPEELAARLCLLAGTLDGGSDSRSLPRPAPGGESAERRPLAPDPETFRLLFESAPLGMALFDRDGRVTAANPMFRRILALAADDDLTRRGCPDCLAPDGTRLVDDIALCLTTGRRVTRETICRRGDGASVNLRVVLAPLGAAPGDVIQGLFEDITERRRAEQEQRRFERHMLTTQKFESLGVLAGGVAHDFNNLLVGILGNASLAMMELGRDSPVRDIVRQIEKAGQRAAELTRQMLAYAGRGQFILEPLNLADLARDMRDLITAAISRKITVAYELEEALPPARGDVQQLRQAIMALVTNAAEAIGDASGRIDLIVDALRCERDYLAGCHLGEALPAGVYVRLQLADTGVGMDHETRRRLFEPFFSTKFAGRGLGLPVVFGVVRAHRGALRVDSEPGHGTRVTVLIPALGLDE